MGSRPGDRYLERIGRDQRPADQLGSFIYDEPRDRFISACGIRANTAAGIHCDVTAFTLEGPLAGRWAALTPKTTTIPEGRYGFAHGLDAEADQLLIFSGARAPTANDSVNPAVDAWALKLDQNPVEWAPVSTTGDTPAGVRNSCYAFDPIGRRLVVFGGTPDAQTTRQGVFELNIDGNAGRWQELDLPNTPDFRSSCSAIYDPSGQRILFGFGNNAQTIYADFHALNL
ncbi:MAG: hypothetical protein ACI9OJ_003754 [Myxococcota bacterium]